MQKPKDATRLRGEEILAVIMCTIILSCLSVGVPMILAQSASQVIMTAQTSNGLPSTTLTVEMGETIILTLNLTDFPYLSAYQAVFKYNGTILDMTSLTFPTDDVFKGDAYYSPPPLDTEAAGDTQDFYNYTMAGAVSTLPGTGSVAVSNGVLFVANFTVVGIGETTISLATVGVPVHFSTSTWYTYCIDANSVEYNNFVTTGVTVLSGVTNAKPAASYIVTAQQVDVNGMVLLYASPPGSVGQFASAWKGLPVYFNASNSYAPTGNITEYIWSFGDGNTTTVKVTGTSADWLITHVYGSVGAYFTSLTVVASGSNGSSPLVSEPYPYYVVVSLAVPLYNWSWFIYTVAALVVAAIVISAARSAVRFTRRRRSLKQKTLKAGSSGRPPTTAQAA